MQENAWEWFLVFNPFAGNSASATPAQNLFLPFCGLGATGLSQANDNQPTAPLGNKTKNVLFFHILKLGNPVLKTDDETFIL